MLYCGLLQHVNNFVSSADFVLFLAHEPLLGFPFRVAVQYIPFCS
jgi:hypothetical protein